MERHLVKEDLKYLIALFSDTEDVSYLRSLHYGKYEFVYDISLATKTKSRSIAEDLKNYYYSDTGDKKTELVVLPIITSYTLVEE